MSNVIYPTNHPLLDWGVIKMYMYFKMDCLRGNLLLFSPLVVTWLLSVVICWILLVALTGLFTILYERTAIPKLSIQLWNTQHFIINRRTDNKNTVTKNMSQTRSKTTTYIYVLFIYLFLAHRSRRLMWGISIARLRRPSVVVHTFKRHLLWSHWANWAHILSVASFGRGNKSLCFLWKSAF